MHYPVPTTGENFCLERKLDPAASSLALRPQQSSSVIDKDEGSGRSQEPIRFISYCPYPLSVCGQG